MPQNCQSYRKPESGYRDAYAYKDTNAIGGSLYDDARTSPAL